MTPDLATQIGEAAVRLPRLAAAELWLSTIVCLIVYATVRILRGRWPAFEHALWALVLVRLILPPSLAHPFGLGSLLRALGDGVSTLTVDETGGSPTATTPSQPRTPPAPNDSARPWATSLVLCWGLGVVALLARDARARHRCHHLLEHASLVTTPEVLKRAESWRRRLTIRRHVRLLAADGRFSPFTLGLLQPVVVVPQALLERGRSVACEAALAHELAHVARWDDLWLGLQRLLARLYFFHPAVWLASRRLDLGRESLADDLVVSSRLMRRRDYARGLVDVLQLNLQGVGAPSLLTDKRRIAMRLRSILRMGALHEPRGLAALAAAALMGGFLLPLAAETSTAQSKSTAPETQPTVSAPAPSLASPLPSARISASFGEMKHPLTGKRQQHTGVDLVAPLETAVLAAADGVIETATTEYAPRKASGTVVVIDHGGDLKTFYAHLGALRVQPGQHVKRGETLALVGVTGTTTGPHVHFAVWRHAQQVDPQTLVGDLGPTSTP